MRSLQGFVVPPLYIRVDLTLTTTTTCGLISCAWRRVAMSVSQTQLSFLRNIQTNALNYHMPSTGRKRSHVGTFTTAPTIFTCMSRYSTLPDPFSLFFSYCQQFPHLSNPHVMHLEQRIGILRTLILTVSKNHGATKCLWAGRVHNHLCSL